MPQHTSTKSLSQIGQSAVCRLLCLWLLILAGCGRLDTETGNTGQAPETQAVAGSTTLAVEVGPQAAATSAPYPAPSAVPEAVPEVPSILLAAPDLGVMLDEQNIVVAVLDGSAADDGGVQIGDTVVALDALPLAKGLSIIRDYLSAKPEGTAMRLTVIRNNQEQQIEITSKHSPPAALNDYLNAHPDLPWTYHYL